MPDVERSGYVETHDDEIPMTEMTPNSIRQPRQSSERRVSFGSVFLGSSGDGNGNGEGRGSFGIPQLQVAHGSRNATFNIRIKPKGPPVFHGRANEDVDTWVSKVGDFLHLTEANSR